MLGQGTERCDYLKIFYIVQYSTTVQYSTIVQYTIVQHTIVQHTIVQHTIVQVCSLLCYGSPASFITMQPDVIIGHDMSMFFDYTEKKTSRYSYQVLDVYDSYKHFLFQYIL